MISGSEKPAWYSFYMKQIDETTIKYSTPFEGIIKDYSNLLQKFQKSQEQLAVLEKQDLLAKSVNQDPKILILKDKIGELEKLLRTNYQEKMDHSSELLSLNKKINELELENKNMEIKLNATIEMNKQLEIVMKKRVKN